MEQTLVNLVVNSRDAMPDGGILTIETAQVELGIDYIRIHPYVEPGRYVRITVTDNGKGMDEETRNRIFEPFFTTKEMGSGLGLATVYGIVKQSGGSIEVSSEEGEGTTFRIFIPVVDLPSQPFSVPRDRTDMQRGDETILVVEDEDGVRAFASEILTELGYKVHDFGNPEEAWEFCESKDRDLDLILTDVIMPGTSGADLVERLKRTYPETPAVFMSGHTDDFIVHHGVLDEGVEFLPKPFSPQELSSRIRKLLDIS
jgi:CheY-like chemotaxis protein